MLTLEYGGDPVRLFEDVDGDGRVWFVSRDVARILGYCSAGEMIRAVDKEELRLYTLQTRGGRRRSSLISGEGLLYLLFRARIKKAVPFKHWLMREVLAVNLRQDINTDQEGETL